MRKVALLFLAFVPAFIFGAVTIPAGAEVIIDENNLSDYSQGIVFADNSAVVRFNLQSAPSMPIAGGGTIVKVSDADWTMTTSIPDFTGDYILAGSGVVSAGIVEALGRRYRLQVEAGCRRRAGARIWRWIQEKGFCLSDDYRGCG